MLRTKRECFEAAMACDGSTSIVAVTAAAELVKGLPHGVDVSTGAVTLNYSYRFGVRINTDDLGISADLSFSGRTHAVFVPWTAIGMIHECATGEVAVWQQRIDLPMQEAKPRGLRVVH